jgi:hypothetical protein
MDFFHREDALLFATALVTRDRGSIEITALLQLLSKSESREIPLCGLVQATLSRVSDYLG